MADDIEDVVASRRYAMAALIRAFAWPIVAVGAIFYFGQTIDRMALATQRVKFAGIEIERWKSTARLSDEQVKLLSKLSPNEVVEYALGIGRGSYYCLKEGESPKTTEKLYIDIGLAQISTDGCQDFPRSVSATVEGRRLSDALRDTLKELVTEQLGAESK